MGEIADSMIDGEVCESCGEYIGPATGFPRKCLGCGGGGTKSNSAKRQRRSERRRNHEKDVFKSVNEWVEKNGLDINKLKPWHLRISRKDLTIDLFPQRKRFHNITTNIRGSYENEIDFLTQNFTA